MTLRKFVVFGLFSVTFLASVKQRNVLAELHENRQNYDIHKKVLSQLTMEALRRHKRGITDTDPANRANKIPTTVKTGTLPTATPSSQVTIATPEVMKPKVETPEVMTPKVATPKMATTISTSTITTIRTPPAPPVPKVARKIPPKDNKGRHPGKGKGGETDSRDGKRRSKGYSKNMKYY